MMTKKRGKRLAAWRIKMKDEERGGESEDDEMDEIEWSRWPVVYKKPDEFLKGYVEIGKQKFRAP